MYLYSSVTARTDVCAAPCLECLTSSEPSLAAFWWTHLCLGIESLPSRQTCETNATLFPTEVGAIRTSTSDARKFQIYIKLVNASGIFHLSHLRHSDTLPGNAFCQSDEMSFIWVFFFSLLQTCIKCILGEKMAIPIISRHSSSMS